MKACTVNSSRSGDPRTTSTTRIWQSASVKELFQPNRLRCQTAFTWGSQDIRAPRRRMPPYSPAWTHLQPSERRETATRAGLHKSCEKRVRIKVKLQGIEPRIVKWGVFCFAKSNWCVWEVIAFWRAVKNCCSPHIITHKSVDDWLGKDSLGRNEDFLGISLLLMF